MFLFDAEIESVCLRIHQPTARAPSVRSSSPTASTTSTQGQPSRVEGGRPADLSIRYEPMKGAFTTPHLMPSLSGAPVRRVRRCSLASEPDGGPSGEAADRTAPARPGRVMTELKGPQLETRAEEDSGPCRLCQSCLGQARSA